MAKIKKIKKVKIKKPSAKEQMDQTAGYWRRDGGLMITDRYNDEPQDYWKADSVRKASTDSIPKKPKAKKKKKRKVLRIN
tara:strand:+ start:149 stop:388 length:240 start_codon:yes stop_codon:yes gene_type:complete